MVSMSSLRARAVRPLRTLAGQFLLWQLVVLGLVLAAVAAVTVQQSTADFQDSRGSRMTAVAESLASTAVVRGQLTAASVDPRVMDAEIARATSLSGARSVQIVGAGGQVVAGSGDAAPSPGARLGAPVAQGRSWSGDLTIDGRRSVVGQAPVLRADGSDAGQVLGAVVVYEPYPGWWERLADAAPDLVLFMGIAAALGALGAFGLSRLIRRRTRGLEPAEIAGLADHQDALLRGIHEGVVGVDQNGVFTVVNASAAQLLALDPDVVGRPVHDQGLPPALVQFLLAGDDSGSAVLVLDGRTLVLNRRRAEHRGRLVGTVTTFVDRSDLLALESQVSAQTAVTETLRAQTHEFDNRMHTLAGLLQLGETEEALTFIEDLSRQRSQLSTQVTARVLDPRIAALLVAKTSVAAQSGVAVAIEPESHLPRLPADRAGSVLTVLGNLIDNALDAAGAGGQVSVRLSHRPGPDGGLTTVRVADDGPGIPAGDLPQVFERGWSTKPSDATGRGVGLALVRAVCAQAGGSVEAMNGDHGAVFTAVLGGSSRPVAQGGDR